MEVILLGPFGIQFWIKHKNNNTNQNKWSQQTLISHSRNFRELDGVRITRMDVYFTSKKFFSAVCVFAASLTTSLSPCFLYSVLINHQYIIVNTKTGMTSTPGYHIPFRKNTPIIKSWNTTTDTNILKIKLKIMIVLFLCLCQSAVIPLFFYLLNPLMLGGNKRSYLLKQTWN